MAIAFDATSLSTAQTTSPITWNHTCTGSDLILWVGFGLGGTSSDNVTGITYNGTSMTLGTKVQTPLDSWIYLYYLIAPSSGTNTVSVSVSSAVDTKCGASSFTGANQTGQPDATTTNTGSSVTTLATNITTIADNSWVVGVSGASNLTLSAGTGVTSRSGQVVQGVVWLLGDSNSAKTPAGSYSMTFNDSSSVRMATAMASFSPSGGASTSAVFFPKLSLLGVG